FTNQQLIEENSNLLTQTNNNLILEIHSRELAQVELELANAQLTAISSLDALTEIPNRRKLDEYLMQLWTATLKEQLPISIMMIDIDYFKAYNDSQGHLAGDNCLRSVAKVINKCIRKGRDFVARYGGEEFLFVSKGTDREEAWLLGEKIRENVAALGLSHSSSPISDCVTVSVGISCSIPANTDSIIQCIDKADQAMYQAKQDGRNRVIIAD
ncbi:MAG TPA: diguanylate cyclase, partial [Syntrophomonadaceae bacterium]|nr:diguanylate cyclase [Syntrophomonadaceae bacterium]